MYMYTIKKYILRSLFLSVYGGTISLPSRCKTLALLPEVQESSHDEAKYAVFKYFLAFKVPRVILETQFLLEQVNNDLSPIRGTFF